MNRNELIKKFRKKIKNKKNSSVGAWLQICDPNIAEIISRNKFFEWMVLDLEHGVFSPNNLANICRAIEKNNKLKLARLPNKNFKFCSQILDVGFDGFIVPNVKNSNELKKIREAINYPPKGKRGVGFARDNFFGLNFNERIKNPNSPILIAMIENVNAVKNLKSILSVPGLDAILIGPYDLSASLGVTGNFKSKLFKSTITNIRKKSKELNIPVGIHVLNDNLKVLQEYMKSGYKFLPYCTDAIFLNSGIKKATN